MHTLDPIELAISWAEVSNLPSLSYNTLHRGVPMPDEIFVIQPLSPWNSHGRDSRVYQVMVLISSVPLQRVAFREWSSVKGTLNHFFFFFLLLTFRHCGYNPYFSKLKQCYTKKNGNLVTINLQIIIKRIWCFSVLSADFQSLILLSSPQLGHGASFWEPSLCDVVSSWPACHCFPWKKKQNKSAVIEPLYKLPARL